MEENNNFAYIDAANLYKGVEDLGWELDYRRFRIWLKDKYSIERAYLFIGLVPNNKDLYTKLQEMGYVLVYKEVTYDGAGKVKGNCDADLVLRVARDVYENCCEKLVLVTSDGDYAGLVKFLQEKNKLKIILSPSIQERCSILLKRTNAPITYLNDIKNKISLNNKEKAPIKDEP